MDEPEQNEILYRLDERTELIRGDISELKTQIGENDEQIKENANRSKQNRKTLAAITVGFTTAGTVILDKAVGLFTF